MVAEGDQTSIRWGPKDDSLACPVGEREGRRRVGEGRREASKGKSPLERAHTPRVCEYARTLVRERGCYGGTRGTDSGTTKPLARAD